MKILHCRLFAVTKRSANLLSPGFCRNTLTLLTASVTSSRYVAAKSAKLRPVQRHVTSARSLATPFRKKSRLYFLFVCKRTHDENTALPTFCGYEEACRFSSAFAASSRLLPANRKNIKRQDRPSVLFLHCPISRKARFRSLSKYKSFRLASRKVSEFTKFPTCKSETFSLFFVIFTKFSFPTLKIKCRILKIAKCYDIINYVSV